MGQATAATSAPVADAAQAVSANGQAAVARDHQIERNLVLSNPKPPGVLMHDIKKVMPIDVRDGPRCDGVAQVVPSGTVCTFAFPLVTALR
jgi:hypothetical protein